MVEDTITRLDAELGIAIGSGISERFTGNVVGHDQQDVPRTGSMFSNAQYMTINGGTFYAVQGNVSHVTGFSGTSR
jgi:hypothetical protein